MDRSIADIDSELEEEEPRKQRLKELEADLKRLSEARKTQEIALENLRKVAASLDQQFAAEKAKLEEETRGLKEQKQVMNDQRLAINDLTAQIESTKKSLTDAEEKLKQRNELEEN